MYIKQHVHILLLILFGKPVADANPTVTGCSFVSKKSTKTLFPYKAIQFIDLSTCMDECTEDHRCKSFSFNPSLLSCDLADNDASTDTQCCYMHYTKDCGSGSGVCHFIPKANTKSLFIYKTIYHNDLSNCMDECSNDNRCRWFSFNSVLLHCDLTDDNATIDTRCCYTHYTKHCGDDSEDSTLSTQDVWRLTSDSTLSTQDVSGLISDSALSTQDVSVLISDSTLSTQDVSGFVSDNTLSTQDVSGYISDSSLSSQDVSGFISDSTLSTQDVSGYMHTSDLSPLSTLAEGNASPTFIEFQTVTTWTKHEATKPNYKLNNSISSFCTCKCELSRMTMQEKINRRISYLKVDKNELSSRKRKFVSFPDNRMSAKSIGFMGVLIVCIFCLCIVIPDLIAFVRCFVNVTC